MKRLREFDRVFVNLPRAEGRVRDREFECLVIAFDGPSAVLQCLGSPPGDLARRVPNVLMSFEHELGPVGLKGVLTHDDAYLRFTVEDGVELPRRRSTRVALPVPVTLRPAGAGEPSAGTTVDVGADGLLAAVSMPVAVGDAVEAVIEFPAPPGRVELPGRVVRVGDGFVAVEFRHDGPRMRAAITDLVVAVQARRAATAVGASSSLPGAPPTT